MLYPGCVFCYGNVWTSHPHHAAVLALSKLGYQSQAIITYLANYRISDCQAVSKSNREALISEIILLVTTCGHASREGHDMHDAVPRRYLLRLCMARPWRIVRGANHQRTLPR